MTKTRLVTAQDGGVMRGDGARPLGRVAFDDRGNGVWEWRVADGFTRDVDTVRIRCLQEQTAARLALDDEDQWPAAGSERPYFETGRVPSIGSGRRRSLDDMRRLSEEIKRRREVAKSRV
jgi:hypothetical protein